MRKLTIIFICVFFVSCDVYKKASKTKTDTDFTEKIETKIFRKGDTVSYEIPKIFYKDTTIYTYNRQGTTLKTIFNKQGSISKIDCYSSQIEEFKIENRKLLEYIKEKNSEKKEEFNASWIIYILIAFIIIITIAMLLFYKYIKSNTSLVTNFLQQQNK